MANNLFISYDLIGANRDYEPVTKAVKEVGAWAKLEYSFFYVNSAYTAQQAGDHIWKSMQLQDKLIVINSTLDTLYGQNIDPVVLKHMQDQWFR